MEFRNGTRTTSLLCYRDGMHAIPPVRASLRQRRAFSLIELLVVIAVIAIMAMLLLPALRTVKETANTLKCASNMRQVGLFMAQFQQDNHGRMVGQAYATSGTASWCDIINIELLADEAVKLPRMSDPPGTNLLCPNFTAPVGQPRCYTYNYYAAGGDYDRTAKTSDYGVVIDPPSQQNSAYAGWKFYALGAARARFAAASVKVLMQESSGYSDHCRSPGGSARHRGGRLANFLFLDGRVASYANTTAALSEIRHGFQ